PRTDRAARIGTSFGSASGVGRRKPRRDVGPEPRRTQLTLPVIFAGTLHRSARRGTPSEGDVLVGGSSRGIEQLDEARRGHRRGRPRGIISPPDERRADAMRRRRFLCGAAAGGVLLVTRRSLAGPVTTDAIGDQVQTVPKGQLPDFAGPGTPRARELYRYAVEHGDELKYIPCFCGCYRFG